ncbi:NAD(P)-dependent alcohol dehydrogenase [Nocardioides sp. zg-DK7169]|uniref:NAD(P)-dependent alcohol dehydrogenase n=1 Tax=Nocardioides sp. zg-DK7169 TaxID=2736600 RepID=UPI0015516BF8|nr:NAD(P)-dependent alcohol dehydrogenase [Nocardioides sp. zg-DK7169]NPC97622.1 NAD(P)-dependent alcohol dehydrogenase [Nocardioides sp. zg-DK7169]
MRSTTAYQAATPGSSLEQVTIERRDLRSDDVAVRVTHCGVCHSDLHALGASESSAFPVVPGHEFVGEVTAVGAAVTAFAVGDPVAVGNIVDSCGSCPMCRAGQENFCREFPTLTYGGRDRLDGSVTQGAYAAEYVVRDRFVYHRPPGLDPAAVAPLMCAGITVWEPLRRWQVGPGTRVGVVGLGGLGHLAVKLAHALGAQVTVFTTSPSKSEDARELGAHHVVISTDESAMAAVADSQDLVIDTVSAAHDLTPYVAAVALDGTLCSLGHLGTVTIETTALLIGRKSLSSAGSGGRPATQDLLDFCGRHGITADVEVLPSSAVAIALDRLARNDVRYRFVLDLTDLS